MTARNKIVTKNKSKIMIDYALKDFFIEYPCMHEEKKTPLEHFSLEFHNTAHNSLKKSPYV